MSDNTTRLVLRRTSVPKGNKIAIRLDDSVDRTEDLYDLFREGIVVEVLDVQDAAEPGTYITTLGVNAHPDFRVDRGERVLGPRTPEEIAQASGARIRSFDYDALSAMPLSELDSRVAELRDADRRLTDQIKRLKRDRALAASLGWDRRQHAEHLRWELIGEELIVLQDQAQRTRQAIKATTAARGTARARINEQRRTSFQDHFLRLARETLPAVEYQRLHDTATNLTNKEHGEPPRPANASRP